MEGVDERRDGQLITKISRIYRLPFFSYITHGALASMELYRARELRY